MFVGMFVVLKVDLMKYVVVDLFMWQDGIVVNYQLNGFSVLNIDIVCNLKVMVQVVMQYGVVNVIVFGLLLFCLLQIYMVVNVDQIYMFVDMVYLMMCLYVLFVQYVEQQIVKFGVGK